MDFREFPDLQSAPAPRYLNVTLAMPDSSDDLWLTAQIEAAVAPYKDRLSEAEIAWMREQLAEVLAGDPAASTLVRRARPITVDESGEVRRGPGGKVVQTPAGTNVVSIHRNGKKVG
jgi:hypothetical protein